MRIYEFDNAPRLEETGMMSMPTMSEPAPAPMTEWARSKGQVVKVLFDDGVEGGFSLVWSGFGPQFPLPRHSHSREYQMAEVTRYE